MDSAIQDRIPILQAPLHSAEAYIELCVLYISTHLIQRKMAASMAIVYVWNCT